MIESKIEALTIAIEANTAALTAILAASANIQTTSASDPAVAPEQVKPERVKPAKGKAKATPEAESETIIEMPTKVAVTEAAQEVFSDPLDPSTVVVTKGTPAPAEVIDVEAVIADIIETYKNLMGVADAQRKAELKEEFPKLRAKWGLVQDAKLITLSDRPQNLLGLLADIKEL